MLWIVDECVSRGIVEALRSQGHDALDIADAAPSSGDVPIFFARGQRGSASPCGGHGFRRVAVSPQAGGGTRNCSIAHAIEAQGAQISRLMSAVEQFGESLYGRYVVVEETRFRVRALES
jgi:hypothetical protein